MTLAQVLAGFGCFVVGFIMGHNHLWTKTSNDVAFAAKLRAQAASNRQTAKLVGRGMLVKSTSSVLFSESGDHKLIIETEA